MRLFFVALALAVLGCNAVFAVGNGSLVSAPMQGHTTATTTRIWILVKNATTATITLTDTLSGNQYTNVLNTDSQYIYKDYTPLVFDFVNLTGNSVYKVVVSVDGNEYKVDRLYRTAKTNINDTYKFIVTSCALSVPFGLRWVHPGIEDRTYKYVVKTEADFTLWTGDYLYYFPKHYRSENGMSKRWVWKRKHRLINNFTERMPMYSIWDDHEFGWNDADGSFPRKEHSLKLFKSFWANPAYGTDETPGCFFKFDYLDSELFMLDARYYRTQPTDSNPTMLGAGQLAWFKEQLRGSKAVFKFVAIGSQVFNQVSHHECYWQFQKELQDLVGFIRDNGIEGVIFLTGDRHHSELMKTDFDNLYPVYEFTSSGITSFRRRTRRTSERVNPTRVEGTLADFQNYGRITVTGEQGDRNCILEIFNKRGEKVWEYTINQNELKFKPAGISVPVKMD